MNFFKRLFSREPENIDLNSTELKEWLENISADVLADVNSKIQATNSEIDEHRTKLRNNLVNLESTKLINPNIPEREKHIMQGNRSNYVQKANQFLDNINLPKRDYEQIEDFTRDFEDKLKKFNENTSRAYFVLKNYFDKEMIEIAHVVKNIESKSITLMNLVNNTKIKQYKSLFARIKELNNNLTESEKISKNILEFENELDEVKKRKVSLQKKIDALKQSRDFKEFYDLEQQRKDIEKGISSVNQGLNNSLKNVDKALRKLLHDTKNKLIAAYLESPLTALEQDTQLELLTILSTLKKEIVRGHIEVKYKDKVLNNLKNINRDYLKNILEENGSLKRQRSDINQRRKNLSVMADYKDVEYQIDHVTEKIENLTNLIKEKKNYLAHLETEQKLKRLERALSEYSGYNVNLVS